MRLAKVVFLVQAKLAVAAQVLFIRTLFLELLGSRKKSKRSIGPSPAGRASAPSPRDGAGLISELAPVLFVFQFPDAISEGFFPSFEAPELDRQGRRQTNARKASKTD